MARGGKPARERRKRIRISKAKVAPAPATVAYVTRQDGIHRCTDSGCLINGEVEWPDSV
jgi:hypothetical protein